ncbi:MAG: sterol-binding protein [Thermoplasmata archaeon HGW-Thermoplasmata-1]|nr:MAG: sterol-binding protein [Thermoplasmata archaeon HGW-Thermoplasmata-1]
MGEIASPKEFFESVMPSRFDAEKAAGIDCIIQMSITGPNGGEWQINVKDQKMNVSAGVNPSPTITVTMSDEDFLKMVNGTLGTMAAFFTGKLKFKGDMATALKLQKIGIFNF